MDEINDPADFAIYERQVTQCIDHHDFNTALTQAKAAAKAFLSPGYMLTAQTYYAMSAQANLDPHTAKMYIENTLDALNEAISYLPQSKEIMSEAGYVLTTDTIEQFAEVCQQHCEKLGVEV